MFCMKILQLFEPQLSDCQRQDHLPHARRHLRSDSNGKLKQIARRLKWDADTVLVHDLGTFGG